MHNCVTSVGSLKIRDEGLHKKGVANVFPPVSSDNYMIHSGYHIGHGLHDAGASLTGRRDVLAWFYDPLACISAEMLRDGGDGGNAKAKRLLGKCIEPSVESIRDARIEPRVGTG